MAGHSKWANIKHRKDRQDAKRGKIFTKLARAITVAAREGGGDPTMNFALRLAVDKARAGNMPKDNIDRAIARGTGDGGATQVERVVYEGYGPASSAVMVEATTDNRNRTVGEVRNLFSKHGGNLGQDGTVAWQFEQRGMIMVPAEGVDSDELALEAIDAGAIDVEVDEELVTVYTEVVDFARVKQSLADAGYNTDDAELAMIPTTPVELELKQTVSVLKFVDKLEDLDDVDKVYTNVEISEEAAMAFDEEG
jgi:YebC/PmpR family DNA-binding regulatory protein